MNWENSISVFQQPEQRRPGKKKTFQANTSNIRTEITNQWLKWVKEDSKTWHPFTGYADQRQLVQLVTFGI